MIALACLTGIDVETWLGYGDKAIVTAVDVIEQWHKRQVQ